MKKIILILILIFTTTALFAQFNLISNPSFEEIEGSICSSNVVRATFFNEFDSIPPSYCLIKDWIMINGSPDVFRGNSMANYDRGFHSTNSQTMFILVWGRGVQEKHFIAIISLI